MSNVRCLLAASLALGFVVVAGCEDDGPTSNDPQPRTLDLLLGELSMPNPAVQSRAVGDLLQLPADELKGAVEQIKKAHQIERNPQIKKLISKVLKKAGG